MVVLAFDCTDNRHEGEARIAKLRQVERLLQNGQLTAMEFIDRNCHSSDGVIERAIVLILWTCL